MPFLLIGGHAVNAFGISRQTGDIDLLVERKKRQKWIELMEKLRYSITQGDNFFAKFRPNTLAAWPIDLMFVEEDSFKKLLADSVNVDVGTILVPSVSPRHLVTLKIHALKHYQEHRYIKDFTDVVQLLRIKCSDLTTEELRELCLKYADLKLFDKLIAEIKT